jgi:hypothetical protein
MIPMKISHPKLPSLKMPSCVECFVLLHSPIIIDMKKLEAINLKVQKNVTDDEMGNDIYTKEMSDFFSISEIVTVCILRWKTIHSLGCMKLNTINSTKKLVV